MEKKHILVVEDDTVVSDSLAFTLREAGYYVDTTVSGRSGVQMALKNHPDLIIADLILPDINGAEMVAEIRRDPWGKNAKVLVLTNINEEQIRNKLEDLNISRFLLKVDNTLKQIAQEVGKILEKSPSFRA